MWFLWKTILVKILIFNYNHRQYIFRQQETLMISAIYMFYIRNFEMDRLHGRIRSRQIDLHMMIEALPKDSITSKNQNEYENLDHHPNNSGNHEDMFEIEAELPIDSTYEM